MATSKGTERTPSFVATLRLKTSEHVEIEKAEQDWPRFSIVLNKCVSEMKEMKSERKFISSFGI